MVVEKASEAGVGKATVLETIPQPSEPSNTLSIAYVTMQFPYPSETFACNDVRILMGRGVEIVVHSLKGKHPETAQLVQERDIEEVPFTHSTPTALLHGLTYGIAHPFLFASFLSWIVRTNWRNPEHLLKSLVLFPRSLDIYAQVERDKPNVVHIYWGHYPSLVGYLVERYLPTVNVTMSLLVYDMDIGYEGSKVVAQQADAVRTLAHVNIDEIKNTFNVSEKVIEVIYDGVDMERIHRQLSGIDLKRAKQSKRILSAGRLVTAKGMSELLDVFATVLAQHPDATLIILGDGEEREALEAKSRALGVAQAVEFKGHVNHDEVFAEMAQAEIFLFLSHAERLPNVVKEAMLCECVCVVSDTVGIRELIPDESYGYVVETVDQASAAVLETLAPGAEEEIRALVDKASSHIAENLAVETSASQYIELWERVTQGKKAQS